MRVVSWRPIGPDALGDVSRNSVAATLPSSESAPLSLRAVELCDVVSYGETYPEGPRYDLLIHRMEQLPGLGCSVWP